MPSDNLRYEYGLELTFCVTLKLYNKMCNGNSEPWNFSPHTALEDALGVSSTRFHCNSDELEVQSPVMSRVSKIQTYYEKIVGGAAKLGLRPHLTGHMSGGGHLHVTPHGARWEPGLVAEIVRDWLNRPYLNWIFNDPNDDQNASSYFSPDFLGCIEDVCECLWNLKKPEITKRQIDDLHQGKDRGVSWRPEIGRGTIEFRFFDAPRDWREQELHIRFVDAWLGRLERRWRPGHRTPLRYRWPSDIEALTYRECAEEFRQMLRELRLDQRDYEHFLKNMRERYQHGLRRD